MSNVDFHEIKWANILLDGAFFLFQGRLQSQDSGKHLHDVLDLLQKHTLVEADISAQAERIKGVQGAAKRFTSYEQGKSYIFSVQSLRFSLTVLCTISKLCVFLHFLITSL